VNTPAAGLSLEQAPRDFTLFEVFLCAPLFPLPASNGGVMFTCPKQSVLIAPNQQ